jgi:long-chain acyl-CoA synthetase
VASPPDPGVSARPWVASYPPGVPPTYRLPTVRLPRLLDDAARDFPEHVALEYGPKQLTFAALRERVASLAAALQELPGPDAAAPLRDARVLVRLPDGFAGPVILFALWRAGAVPVPLAEDVRADRLAALGELTGSTGVICTSSWLRGVEAPGLRFVLELKGDEWDPQRGPRVLRALPSLPRFPRWRHRGRTPERADDADLHDADLVAEPGPGPVSASVADLLVDAAGRSWDPPPLDPGGPALLVVRDTSSGPVLTEHTHRTLLATAFQSRLWIPDVQAGRERMLVTEPIHDLVGSTVGLLSAVLSGATTILIDTSDGSLARAIERTAPTLLIARAPRVTNLLHEGDAGRRDLTSLRVCLAVGEGLVPDVALDLEKRTAGARFRPVYGCGDAAPLTHGQPVYGRVIPTAMGLPITSTIALVADLDDPTRPVEPGEPGRLLVDGPQLPRGKVDGSVEGGWLVTDLIVRVDEGGWFTLIGHQDEVVSVGGDLRAPRRIVAALEHHPSVSDAEVVDVDDRLVAAVVAARRRTPDADVLRRALALHLDVRAMPDEILVIGEVPKADGEPDPDALREALRQRIRDAAPSATVHTGAEDEPAEPPDAGRTAT